MSESSLGTLEDSLSPIVESTRDALRARGDLVSRTAEWLLEKLADAVHDFAGLYVCDLCDGRGGAGEFPCADCGGNWFKACQCGNEIHDRDFQAMTEALDVLVRYHDGTSTSFHRAVTDEKWAQAWERGRRALGWTEDTDDE